MGLCLEKRTNFFYLPDKQFVLPLWEIFYERSCRGFTRTENKKTEERSSGQRRVQAETEGGEDPTLGHNTIVTTLVNQSSVGSALRLTLIQCWIHFVQNLHPV